MCTYTIGANLHSAVDLGQIAVGYHLRRLVADTNLESSWAPVHELYGALRFEGSNSCMDIVGHDVSTVQQASGHVFPIARIALHHLLVLFEARHGNFLYGASFV